MWNMAFQPGFIGSNEGLASSLSSLRTCLHPTTPNPPSISCLQDRPSNLEQRKREDEDSSELTSEPRSRRSWQTHLIMEITLAMFALELKSSEASILLCGMEDAQLSAGLKYFALSFHPLENLCRCHQSEPKEQRA